MTPTTLRALAARLETRTDNLDTLAVDVCVELQWVPKHPDARNIKQLNGHKKYFVADLGVECIKTGDDYTKLACKAYETGVRQALAESESWAARIMEDKGQCYALSAAQAEIAMQNLETATNRMFAPTPR